MVRKMIANLDELNYQDFEHGDKFQSKRVRVTPLIGGEKPGCTVVVLPPGKRAWPYHSHYVNEELFFVLEGEGTLRHSGEERAIRAGDFIAAPADPDQPHQIINTSDAELKYLCISTMEDPEICLYPDSDKYGVYRADFEKMDDPKNFFAWGRKETDTDYWHGED